MMWGRDALALAALTLGWSYCAWHAGRMDGATSPRRTRHVTGGLALAGLASVTLAVEHAGHFGFLLDDQLAWPGSVLAVAPVVAVAATAAGRARRGEAAPPALACRAGVYASVALAGFELFPHGRLRLVDVLTPVAVTVATALVDGAVTTRTTPRPGAGRALRTAGAAGLAVLTLAGTLATAAVTSPRPELPAVPAAPVVAGSVTTEGDTLRYEVRGHGTPLLLIAGGGGEGAYYRRLADVLAPHYEVVTYDRRGNGRSTRNHPVSFSLEQQARDALAVLRAAGLQSAIVMGSSGGGLIALQLAADAPEAVRRLVVHEVPMMAYDPRTRVLLRSAVATAARHGSAIGALEFLLALGIPASAFGATPDGGGRGYDAAFVVQVELPGITGTTLDVDRVAASGIPVTCAVGELTRRQGRIQGASMQRLAAELHAPLAVFPGHHLSYQDDPVGWAAALRAAIEGDGPGGGGAPAA